ncbi:glycoside hydrolase [Trichoderma arundinaceum]|uniref:Glycoside hydrolase n=1 Tax=Trichoderma arundinaceum TaxID=490622 RepID=A0A395NMU6_TRIAR|nr:glycoside hydrolase [Trichoderma arundinaceum]
MAFKTMLLAALAALPAAFASPIDLESRAGCTYNGPYQNFPPMSSWLPWTEVFGRYEQTMVNAGSTWDDVGRINVAISAAASSIGVDERVILAIIIQESTGNVGVICTGDDDCGLMQCGGCAGFPGQNNLPQSSTSAMINGGTQHFKGNLRDFGDLWDVSSIYPALREYNSGSVNSGDLSTAAGGFGVPCYVSDVARRMMGQVF